MSWQSFHETRISQQTLKNLSKIFLQILRCLGHFLNKLFPPVNQCNNIFDIVASHKITIATTFEGFKFSRQKKGSGHNTDG